MRIAVDATPLLQRRTGVGEFVNGLLTALPQVEPNDDVAAYALTWRGHEHLSCQLPPNVTVTGRAVPARALRESWRRWSWPPGRAVIGPADVIHGTNYVVPPARKALVVVSVHDLTFLHYPEMCEPVTLQLPQLIRRAIRRGAVVQTPSEFIAVEVRDWLGLQTDRVFAVHYGVPDNVEASPGQGRRLAGGRRYVLALGTVEPRKGLPDLVKAFNLLASDHRNLALVIAGPGGWGSSEVDEAIASSPVRERIHRLGWVDAGARASLLAEAAVLAYPSRYEGFGFPPLEAMQFGVPVVATRTGSLPEILGNHALFVPVGDVNALAEGLSTTVDDRLASGAAARQAWAASFTWRKCAAEMRAQYLQRMPPG